MADRSSDRAAPALSDSARSVLSLRDVLPAPVWPCQGIMGLHVHEEDPHLNFSTVQHSDPARHTHPEHDLVSVYPPYPPRQQHMKRDGSRGYTAENSVGWWSNGRNCLRSTADGQIPMGNGSRWHEQCSICEWQDRNILSRGIRAEGLEHRMWERETLRERGIVSGALRWGDVVEHSASVKMHQVKLQQLQYLLKRHHHPEDTEHADAFIGGKLELRDASVGEGGFQEAKARRVQVYKWRR
nr:hypothetical protein CFP56_64717 [Quercus suber]